MSVVEYFEEFIAMQPRFDLNLAEGESSGADYGGEGHDRLSGEWLQERVGSITVERNRIS